MPQPKEDTYNPLLFCPKAWERAPAREKEIMMEIFKGWLAHSTAV